MTLAILAEGLSKSYKIRHRHAAGPTRATEALVARLRHPFQRDTFEMFEALTDISFQPGAFGDERPRLRRVAALA